MLVQIITRYLLEPSQQSPNFIGALCVYLLLTSLYTNNMLIRKDVIRNQRFMINNGLIKCYYVLISDNINCFGCFL